jgi:hypothetical protein
LDELADTEHTISRAMTIFRLEMLQIVSNAVLQDIHISFLSIFGFVNRPERLSEPTVHKPPLNVFLAISSPMGLYIADEPVKSVVAFHVFIPPCSEHMCGHTVFSVMFL